MAVPGTPATGAVDHEMVAEALRSLGMLYGTQGALAPILADGRDESEVIRSYILRERPHLLKCYDLEVLVGLVRAAIEGREYAPALEQFVPS
jgi:DNA-binding NarL/FixJ family response regulator